MPVKGQDPSIVLTFEVFVVNSKMIKVKIGIDGGTLLVLSSTQSLTTSTLHNFIKNAIIFSL